MRRYGSDGNRIVGKFDLSPNEREWLRLLKGVATAVLDYESDPRQAIFAVDKDLKDIYRAMLDIDALYSIGIASALENARLPEASTGLLTDEIRFWNGIQNGCEFVLKGKVDFLYFYEALDHDIDFISSCNGILIAAIATRMLSPKVNQWSEVAA